MAGQRRGPTPGLREMPRHLSVPAAAEFPRLAAADVRRAIEAGELAPVTDAGGGYVITRVLQHELGAHLEDAER